MDIEQNTYSNQIHRLRGQLAAIEKMIALGQPLQKIIQQAEAVRGSLRTLEQKLIRTKLGELGNEELQAAIEYIVQRS